MNKIVTDEAKIDEILNRGTIVNIFPTKEEFKKKLLSGEKLRFYIGLDATAPTLHLSHAKNIILMEKFRKLGHEVIILFGDFTARIGDPTGENSKRKELSRKEVLANVKKWKSLIKPLMDFSALYNPPKIKYNHKWLSKLNFEDLIGLANNFTVQQIIERDMFDKRIKAGKPIYLSEFLYPLMQGYDSVAMNVDVEVCGTDQIFNALAGRTLLRKLKGKDKFVVALTLMENPKTGELMSKSKGTGVFLGGKAGEMFGQIMAQPDEMMEILFVNNTLLLLNEIKEILKDNDPKKIKLRLATEIIKIFYGEKEAIFAQKEWEETFSKKEIPENTPTTEVSSEELLIDIFLNNDIVSSKTEFRRLVKAQAVTNLSTKEKIQDNNIKAKEGVYRIGKKRFLKINIK